MELVKTLAWEAAPSEILAAAAAFSGRVTIGITGPVGSGKSSLARRLSDCIVSTDDYLPDYDLVPFDSRDLPESADLAGLASHLHALKLEGGAEIPIWSFQTHRREGSRRVQAGRIIVCEGIHALHETVTPHLDLRIFVDAPATVRWSRWEDLERSGQRGWGVEAAREFFDRVAEPTFARFAPGYRTTAHYIVDNR